ncbi:glycoprotein [Trichosporon asahii var. asahii CBS 2479]|uniref:Glycoprotein n=1 Tax=Trichosporon asahii var. asahii (strain ATCC 90039 / CBS 2479 / JCM 2466 / KCTC 7840 / NBRC 103889/ NCYC 2677 / UAMH 7654) TaxID=1186058 RepID=J6F3S6_TRIAS|nr:glycoprotein [Trichosporon asahii var. asahii CBS 2479]EJT49892.1 glycoprotein [Trichosporon asahii var. asahii CBS 2479]
MLPQLAAALLASSGVSAQVTAAFPNGPTNPEKPEFYPIGAQVNQTSLSRLLSLNGIDDFCMYGPPEPGPDSVIGNIEDRVVAYCTKPRNNARIIPDGTITAAHLVKTPAYIQIHGFWDGTRINIVDGDSGGELDPHGAKNLGNPIGGNVTTNLATGEDVFYEEWMSFISFDQFCLRICTAEVNGTTTALQCEHELDIMGCRWVMAITDFEASRTTGFTECDGEIAMAPGLYPLKNGTTSTFRQRYTGTWTNEEKETGVFTVGQLVTPTAPAFWPKSSNCKTYSTISNGVDMKDLMVKAAPTVLRDGSAVPVTGLPSTTPATVTTPTSVPPSVTPTSAGAGSSDAKPTDGGKDGASSDSAAAGAETTKNGDSAAAGKPAGGAGALSAPALLASVCGVALGALALL